MPTFQIDFTEKDLSTAATYSSVKRAAADEQNGANGTKGMKNSRHDKLKNLWRCSDVSTGGFLGLIVFEHVLDASVMKSAPYVGVLDQQLS